MEKRVLLAALLSSVFLAWYAQTIGKVPATARPLPAAKQPSYPPEPIPTAQRTDTLQLIAEEEVTLIESAILRLEIGRTSGSVRRVIMKQFLQTDSQDAVRLGSRFPILSAASSGGALSVHSEQLLERGIAVDATDPEGKNYYIKYQLDANKPLLYIEINSLNDSIDHVVLTNVWERADKLSNQGNPLEAFIDQKRFAGPWKSERNVPRGTSLLTLSERYFCQSLKPEDSSLEIALVPSDQDHIRTDARVLRQEARAGKPVRLTVYFGARDYFRLKNAGFEQAFPIGILGQIGLVLLFILSGIAKLTRNYGIAVIVFSGLFTTVTAPFTLMGIRSMKKMQELKPKIDRIMAEHKNDPKEANQKVFALYREHRVSPFGGCLPMVLQMPIFIALYQAISHFIELRGARFLWIRDLSLPDRIAQLPASIPLIGNELNLLPIIMAGAMFIQGRLNQPSGAAFEGNPTAKMLSGPLMPILFCFMFYHIPSGLVLYWLTNSLLSLVIYRMAK